MLIKSIAQVLLKKTPLRAVARNKKNAPKNITSEQEQNAPRLNRRAGTCRLRRKRQKFNLKIKNLIKSVANG